MKIKTKNKITKINRSSNNSNLITTRLFSHNQLFPNRENKIKDFRINCTTNSMRSNNKTTITSITASLILWQIYRLTLINFWLLEERIKIIRKFQEDLSRQMKCLWDNKITWWINKIWHKTIQTQKRKKRMCSRSNRIKWSNLIIWI